ncbi:hypothetical protein BG015_001133 [Linnemannia schmuckeri]|uniref:F-box domain-containing protein n=1 Tax=Linnemannia schmuckeri TaxID=64567 RepID=A0A9P5S9G1_9FUNG|nr:hypothetical protein BG015_001133 [Linnemannia schmuckeri]
MTASQLQPHFPPFTRNAFTISTPSPGDLLRCRLVCRLWETLFTPYIARTVSDRSRPWFDTSRHQNRTKWEAIVAAADTNNAVRATFIQKHKDHVRHLTLYDQWLLVTILRTPLTQLTLLRIHGHFTKPSGETLPDEYADISKALFSVTTRRFPAPLSLNRTRACWQIIRNNPNLKHLWISTGAHEALFGFTMASPGVPTAEVEAFVMSTLLGLHKLRYLQLDGSGLDEFVLQRLPTHFPWITSFVYTGKVAGLSELPPGFCTTLQHITIFASLVTKDAHRVLRAFPALRTFELPYFTSSRNKVLEPNSEEIVTHPFVERLSSSNVASLTLLKVCFPKVRKVTTFNNFTNFITLLTILRMLPGLEKLQVLNIYSVPETSNDNSTAAVDQGDVQLRSIYIQNHPWYPSNITQLLSRAPHLVNLEVCYIPREAISTIAQTCRNMERLQFSVTQRCFKEIHQVLVECPKLKSLQGQGLAVAINDILQGPGWTCLGLVKFQCGIMGVPRLSSEEEMFLKYIKRDSLSSDDIEKAQRILEKQQRSWTTQEKVLRYLAQFKELQHLDIGFVKLPCRQRHKRWVCTLNRHCHRMSNIPVPDSLELSIASGLAQLASLSRLEMFGFKEVDHRIADNELRWIAEHWKLRRMYGFGGCVVDGAQLDKKVQDLHHAVRMVVPRIVILEHVSGAVSVRPRY